jgi:NAD(P)-dependent dehydrogenase (short-subunit alcohol dehydrogenase family)
MDLELSGRVAIVGGASEGIGRATAKLLAMEGCRVVLAARRERALENAATMLRNLLRNTTGTEPMLLTVPCDMSSQADIERLVARTVAEFGGIDIIVNNAAILRDSFIFKAEPLNWEAVIRNNLSAPFYLTQAASAVMREQGKSGRGGASYGWGRIVNIVSSAGLYGNLGQAAYASAKAGLVGLTRVTAMDLVRAGITCNAVAPFARTRVTDIIQPANDAQKSYKERALRIDAAHVARLVAALAGPECDKVTGQIFGVRGREVFLFSQPRPKARIVNEKSDWDLSKLAAAINADLAPGFTDLTTDLEAFNTEPFV